MTGRVLAGLFGAMIFALMFPLGYWVASDGESFQSLDALWWQVGIGAGIGFGLGLMFPRVFAFLFEAIIAVSRDSSGI